MKLQNILLYFSILLLSSNLFANTNPVVTNVAFTIDDTTVTITYELKDAEQTTVNIRMLVSEDSGLTWAEKTGEASGDIGDLTDITTTATAQTITWAYTGSNQATMKIKILANDKTAGGSPCPGTATVEYSGKTYNTIQIGDQCWFKENLDVGTMINSTTGGYQQTDNSIIEKYCYNNDENNCDTYGGLYEWTEAMQYVTTPGTQGICPSGWHIPTHAEMQILQTYVNNEEAKLIDENAKGGYTYTNEAGFSALFAGYRYHDDGSFYSLSDYTFFWSSTESNSSYATNMNIDYNNSNVVFYDLDKDNGFSVRCLKN